MKFSIDQKLLDTELKIVRGVIAHKATLPILGCIYIKVKDNKLTLAGTDLEVGIVSEVPVNAKNDGTVALPAGTLADIVGTLPEGEIKFSLKDETRNMTITAPSHRSRIKGLDPEDFPPIPALDYESIGDDILDFKIMVNQVVFAASNDDSRPVLEGVNLSTNGDNELIMAAADGFRLSVSKLRLSENINGKKFNVIVPATSLVDANKTVDLDEDSVFIGPSKTGNRFICQCGHRVLVTQLIPGSFPDFEQIIPKSKTTSVTINSNSFRKALKQAHIFSRDSMNNIVRLVFQNETTKETAEQRLTIVGQSEETGDVSSEIPETQIEGKSLTIAFNANFLLDLMSAVKTDFVLFEGKEPVDPGTFKAVGDDEFLHIIMPMRIEEYAAPIANGDAQEETDE